MSKSRLARATGPRATTTIDSHIGLRVRQRRLALSISQQSLAETLGVSFQQIQKYEKGANRIGAGRLPAIAAALGVETAFFYEGAPGTTYRGAAARDATMDNFLATSDGIKIARAYGGITSRSLRAALVRFVTGLAASQLQAAE